MLRKAKQFVTVSSASWPTKKLDSILIPNKQSTQLKNIYSIKPKTTSKLILNSNDLKQDFLETIQKAKNIRNTLLDCMINSHYKCISLKLCSQEQQLCLFPRFYSTSCSNKSTIDEQENTIFDSIELCTTPEDLLAYTASTLSAGTLHSHHLPNIFTKYQTLVYNQLIPKLTLKNESNQMKQIHLNGLSQKLVTQFVLTLNFQNLLTFSEASVDLLSLEESVIILNALQWLHLPKDNLCFHKLYMKCLENIQYMNLHQLALFSSSLSNPCNYPAMDKVLERAMKCISLEGSNINLNDICILFSHIHKVVSPDLFIACAKKMLSFLEENPSQITFDNLISLIRFSNISQSECIEVVINGILNFPPESYKKIDIEKADIAIDDALTLNVSTWMSSCLKKLAPFSAQELCYDKMLPLKDVVKYSILCNHLTVNDKLSEKLVFFVKELDNYLFIEFLFHYRNLWPLKRKLAEELHDRIVRLIQDLDEDKLSDSIWEYDERLTELIVEYFEKFREINIDIDSRLQKAFDKITDWSSISWCWHKSRVKLIVKDAINRLSSNTPLSPAQLDVLLKLLRCLDLDKLILLNRKIDSLSHDKETDRSLISQIVQIRRRTYEYFNNRLNQVYRMSSVLAKQNILAGLKPHATKIGLFEPLLNRLPSFTAKKDETNCIRALRLIELTADKYPVYQEDTFENLLAFLKSRVNCIYCKFQFVKAVSHAAYTPKDSDTFNAMCQQLCDEIIRTDLLEKRVQVELAYCLSLSGIFFDQFLNRIFTLGFLSELDDELKELSYLGAQRITNILINLSRSAAIECPHLSLHRINIDSPQVSKEIGFTTEKLHSSLSRICGDSSFIQLLGHSPYGHTLDATLYVQARRTLVKPEEAEERLKAGDDIERIVVQYVPKSMFCLNTDHLNGLMSTKIRHLEMLGYIVVLVPYKSLFSMELQRENLLDIFLQKKLNTAVGSELFLPVPRQGF